MNSREATPGIGSDPAHRVIIRPEDGVFVVTVDPAHDQHPPKRFDDHRSARGWGGGVRMVTGWTLVDECQAGDQPRRGR